MNDRSASHSLTAFSASVSKTGWRSNVDRPITLSSSLIAVCCSRASASSCLSLEFPFFASTSAGADLRTVEALCPLTGRLRTACPRFTINVRSAGNSFK